MGKVKEAEKIISEINKPKLNDTKASKTKSKKISKK